MIVMSNGYNRVKTSETKLTETEKFVLSFLVIEKELSKYEVYRAKKHAYSGIYKAVKNLLKNGLIEVSRKGEGERNPKIEVHYYRINLKGIYEFLRASKAELIQYAIANDSPSHSLVDGSDKKWRGIFLSLLKNYPSTFPGEFRDLSKEFALALCADYCFIHAYTGEDPMKWAFVDGDMDELAEEGLTRGMIRGIPLTREYMSETFLVLIEAKTNKKAPRGADSRGVFLLYPRNEKYIKSLCQLMSKKDLEILVNIAEKLTLVRRNNYELVTEELKELSRYLKDVESELQTMS